MDDDESDGAADDACVCVSGRIRNNDDAGYNGGHPLQRSAGGAEGRPGCEGYVRRRIRCAEYYQLWGESFMDGTSARSLEPEDSGAGVERSGMGSAVGSFL